MFSKIKNYILNKNRFYIGYTIKFKKPKKVYKPKEKAELTEDGNLTIEEGYTWYTLTEDTTIDTRPLKTITTKHDYTVGKFKKSKKTWKQKHKGKE